MIRKLVVAIVAGGTILLALSPPKDGGGREVFDRRCGGCHAPDINKEGPRLRGVYGRQSAAVAGFGYSDALKKAGVKWDEVTLDRWLADPDAMVPDTDMAFRVGSADERKAVIAYLKTL